MNGWRRYLLPGAAIAAAGVVFFSARKVFAANPFEPEPRRSTLPQVSGVGFLEDMKHSIPVFGSPLPGKTLVLSGWWDPRPYRNGVHEGFDFRATVGTPVLSSADGLVALVDKDPTGKEGKWIVVHHANGFMSRYMHLSRTDVEKDQYVKRGQQIALSGRTGIFSSGPHLHFDVRVLPSELWRYIKKFGTPTTGFARLLSGGIGVPAEPLIPVSEYRSHILKNARAHGIPVLG